MKELLDGSADSYPILSEYEMDGERILQILSLYYLRKKDKFPEATRSVLLSLTPYFINQQWNSAACHLSEACEWVKQLGATAKTQPPHGTLVSIAATLMCYPGSLTKPEFSTTLRKWYFCSTLAANPSPANNYKTGDDFRKFCDFLETGNPVSYPRVHFSVDELIDIKHISDSRYKAIQALMRTTVKEDLITGNMLNGDLEDHHIFPYSLNKSGIAKNKLNSVVDRIVLSKESNRSIANANPDKYLADLAAHHRREGNIADFNRRLQSCFIPYSCDNSDFHKKFHKDNFIVFLEDRARMIIDRIKSVTGDAWKPPMEQEDDEFVIGS